MRRALPDVPPPVIVNTGNEDNSNQEVQKFFESILSYLGYDGRSAVCFAQEEDYGLTNFGPEEPMRTDNKITLLIVQDILVASVIYRRSQFNLVQIVCAHYLSDQVIERVRFKPERAS
jgi:hypothetical protein